MQHNPLHVELAKLRQRCDALEDEVATLKLQLENKDDEIKLGELRLQKRFGLTSCEAKFLGMLSDGRVKSRRYLADNMTERDAGPRIIDVWKCYVTKKIAPLQIKNVWNTGCYIEGETLQTIQAVMRGEGDGRESEAIEKLAASDGIICSGIEVTDASSGGQREPKHHVVSRC